MKTHKKCSICESTLKVCNSAIGFLCGKHYIQYKRYGKILNRTKYDSNEIEVVKDCAYIVLYDNKNIPIGKAIIDIKDIEIVKKFKWCLCKNGYVKNSNHKYLHRILLEEDKLYVDHINGNTLDNRRCNLRACTNADNLKNRIKIPKNNTSGIIGVRFRKDRNKWYAEIQYNGNKVNLGSFSNLEDAIKARKEAEIKYFGKYKSITQ